MKTIKGFESKIDNKGKNYQSRVVGGRLISISDKLLENVNGTGYYPCTIETKIGSSTMQVSGIMYKANFDNGVEIGDTYRTEIRITEDRPEEPLFLVSHLPVANRVSTSQLANMFGEASLESTLVIPEGSVSETQEDEAPY